MFPTGYFSRAYFPSGYWPNGETANGEEPDATFLVGARRTTFRAERRPAVFCRAASGIIFEPDERC